MGTRRAFLATTLAAPAALTIGTRSGLAAGSSFHTYLTGLRHEALHAGIVPATIDHAFAGLQPNPRVIELDRHQPEFTLTWEQYRSRVVNDDRVQRGRALYQQHRPLLESVASRFGARPGVLMGIWGLESDYGKETGGFNVIEALATLAWEGRRASFFRSELLDALRILQAGDIPLPQMTGSYAGAMGQTQFMPDSFLKYAVAWGGGTRRDIWNDLGCVFASTANYLAREGWASGVPWGEIALLPAGFDPSLAGRDNRKPLVAWQRMGVRGTGGTALPGDTEAAVLLPGGAGSEAFLAYWPSFLAIRRYNPSDFYCISVGLIGDLVTA
jgi:membrane-bound lytic murein transglycosylase B